MRRRESTADFEARRHAEAEMAASVGWEFYELRINADPQRSCTPALQAGIPT